MRGDDRFTGLPSRSRSSSLENTAGWTRRIQKFLALANSLAVATPPIQASLNPKYSATASRKARRMKAIRRSTLVTLNTVQC